MVVKCTKCDQYFTHTEQDTKCPFCQTEHATTEENVEETEETKKVEETETKETKKKKESSKPQKGSFKIWKNS